MFIKHFLISHRPHFFIPTQLWQKGAKWNNGYVRKAVLVCDFPQSSHNNSRSFARINFAISQFENDASDIVLFLRPYMWLMKPTMQFVVGAIATNYKGSNWNEV